MTDVLALAFLFWAPTIAGVVGFELDQATRRRSRRTRFVETEIDVTWEGVHFWRRYIDAPSRRIR